MKGFPLLFTVLAFLAALYFIFQAVMTPTFYTSNNAIQQNTVYAIGTYNGVLAIAFLSLAAVIILSGRDTSGK